MWWKCWARKSPDPSGNACEEKNTKIKESRGRNSPSARKTKIVDGSDKKTALPLENLLIFVYNVDCIFV